MCMHAIVFTDDSAPARVCGEGCAGAEAVFGGGRRLVGEGRALLVVLVLVFVFVFVG